jgi:hypothetical protein
MDFIRLSKSVIYPRESRFASNPTAIRSVINNTVRHMAGSEEALDGSIREFLREELADPENIGHLGSTCPFNAYVERMQASGYPAQEITPDELADIFQSHGYCIRTY